MNTEQKDYAKQLEEQKGYTKDLEDQIQRQRLSMKVLESNVRKAEEKNESQKEMYERLLSEVNEALQKNIEIAHFFYTMWLKSLEGDES